MNMTYTLKNGKNINIDDAMLKKNMEILGLTKEEAIQMYLEDEEIEINEEQAALDTKAKEHRRERVTANVKKAPVKRERKADDEKRSIISQLEQAVAAFQNLPIENVTVSNIEREVTFTINGIAYSLTLTKHREKK